MFENTNMLHIDTENSQYLYQTARWAKFLSVVGFVFCGFIFLNAFFAKPLIEQAFGHNPADANLVGLASIIFTIIYISIAVIYFFPCFYLYKFSKRMQLALENNDTDSLHQSFRSLKSCFKFLGMFTIVVLSVYGIAVILAAIAGAAMHG